MLSPRTAIFLAAACCVVACGERPDPPGRAVSDGLGPSGEAASGAGSAAGSLDRPRDGAEPEPPLPDPPADEPVASRTDAGLATASPDDSDTDSEDDGDDEPASSAAPAAFACTQDGGSCIIVNIAVVDIGEDTCTQLVLDNCESSSQPGLPVDLPVSWQLGSAAIHRTADDCVPGAEFDPANGSTIVDASGSISWNLTTRVPSELVLDVTLEPAVSALDSTPVRISNSDLVDPLIECD